MSTRFEERSRFRRSVMWVLLLSGAACSCARDGVSRTLLLVSVEVSEARSSMSTIDVDTVHSDERTISLAVIFVFIIYVRFIGIFYYPETPSDLLVQYCRIFFCTAGRARAQISEILPTL